MDENNKQKARNLGALCAQGFALVLCACVTAIMIAATVRVIAWIL